MKKIIYNSLSVLAVLSYAGFANAQDSSIKLKNNSNWDIDHVYITPVNKATWGNDLLGADEIMKPGESLNVDAFCGVYDVKIIDQDGISCILEDVDICLDHETWLIGDLTKCGK